MSPRVLTPAYRGDGAHQARNADAWPGTAAPAEVRAFEEHNLVTVAERARARRIQILEQQAAQRIISAVEHELDLNNASDQPDADTGEPRFPGTDKT